jgi:hypothetical protein
LLFFVQVSIASRSDCKVEISFLFTVSNIATSSTYFQWLVLGEVNSRSLIIIIKIGPNFVP